jgi:hypothetical protein
MSEQAAGSWRIDSDLGLHRVHLRSSSPQLGVLAELNHDYSTPTSRCGGSLCSDQTSGPRRGKANRIYKGTRHRGDTCNSDRGLRKLISTVNLSDLPVETWDLRSYWRSDMQLRSSLQWFAVVILRINAWQLSSYLLIHGNCHRTHQRGTAWGKEYLRHKQCLVSRKLFQ